MDLFSPMGKECFLDTFLRKNLAAVLSGTVRHICKDLVLKSIETKNGKLYRLPLNEHEEIMALL